MKQPIKSIILDDEKFVLKDFCQLAQKNCPELIIIKVYHQPNCFYPIF
jgi:hypothetical protein